MARSKTDFDKAVALLDTSKPGVDAFAGLDEEQLDALFQGNADILGSGDGYRHACEWWVKLDKNKKIRETAAKACIAFFDKPARFLAAGQVRKGKRLVEAVSQEDRMHSALARLLPKLSPDAAKDCKGDRKEWGEFANVNVSMTKRVAKFLIGMEARELPAVAKWLEKYGGTWGDIDENSVGWVKLEQNDETKGIFEAHETDALAYKHIWSKYSPYPPVSKSKSS